MARLTVAVRQFFPPLVLGSQSHLCRDDTTETTQHNGFLRYSESAIHKCCGKLLGIAEGEMWIAKQYDKLQSWWFADASKTLNIGMRFEDLETGLCCCGWEKRACAKRRVYCTVQALRGRKNWPKLARARTPKTTFFNTRFCRNRRQLRKNGGV